MLMLFDEPALIVDLWDGIPQKGPIVTHGYTLCTKINSEDALRGIQEIAFVQSEYVLFLIFFAGLLADIGTY